MRLSLNKGRLLKKSINKCCISSVEINSNYFNAWSIVFFMFLSYEEITFYWLKGFKYIQNNVAFIHKNKPEKEISVWNLLFVVTES